MQTSYFAKYRGNNGVSIARFPPKGYKGRQYTKLAPPTWLLTHYKNSGDKYYYIEHYYSNVLNKLNPQEIYNELGENTVLLCYEKSDGFCHRHLVADWLKGNLAIDITEIDHEKKI